MPIELKIDAYGQSLPQLEIDANGETSFAGRREKQSQWGRLEGALPFFPFRKPNSVKLHTKFTEFAHQFH